MTNPTTRTPLSHLLGQMSADNDQYRIAVPADWRQGRAVYGGLSAALCLAAARANQPSLPPLRSAQVSFIGPAGGALRIRPQLLRRGRSAAFVAADLISDDEVAVRTMFCFGTPRQSALAKPAPTAPEAIPPQSADRFFEGDETGQRWPNYAQQFDSCRAAGPLPMSGSDDTWLLAWLRNRDPANLATEAGLVALADGLPPPAMVCMAEIAPVSSMTWQFELHTDNPQTTDGWWLCRSEAEMIGDGYSAQSMAIWNTDGRPVLSGRQCVAVFA